MENEKERKREREKRGRVKEEIDGSFNRMRSPGHEITKNVGQKNLEPRQTIYWVKVNKIVFYFACQLELGFILHSPSCVFIEENTPGIFFSASLSPRLIYIPFLESN